MELRFIWIKEYKIIHNKGFNFDHSGDHHFEYSENNLKITQKEKSIIHFGDNVESVTAIAGMNGAGKSSLCESILESTATFVNGSLGYNIPFQGIVCYNNFLFVHKDLRIDNLSQLEKTYKVFPFEKTPFEGMDGFEWSLPAMKLGFIYYSNVIDKRSENRNTNLANISTNQLLIDDSITGTKYTRQVNEYIRIRDGEVDYIDQLQAHYNEDNYRYTNFIVNFSEIIPFRTPSFFILKSSYSGNNRRLNINNLSSDVQSDLRKIQRELWDQIDNNFDSGEKIIKTIDKESFVQVVTRQYRLNLYKALLLENSDSFNKDNLLEFIYYSKTPSEFSSYQRKIKKLIQIHENIIQNSTFVDQYNPLLMSLNFRNVSPDRLRHYIIQNTYLKNTPANCRKLKRFMCLEEELLKNEGGDFRQISNYGFTPDMSSGEISYLSLFSRLYDKIRNINSGYDFRDHVLLFIDEGEIGYHPEWKRKYLNWLLIFLNGDWHSFKFQLILTTHSPYLLSDLPARNVLLLKKNESQTEIVPISNYKTFGANIHNLLSDSFFLNDTLIGEFADKKILELIERIKINKISELDDALIDEIGDDFLKSSIKLFKQRLNDQNTN
jgi:AAA15 family ATPase/GTPase